MAVNVEDLELLHTKTISYKQQKKRLLKLNLLFVIGAIIPIVNIFFQIPNLSLSEQFGRILLTIMIVAIAIDLVIYIPIYLINRSLLENHKRRFSLLFLYTIRKYERIAFGIYLIAFMYLIIPSDIKDSGMGQIMSHIKDNLLYYIICAIASISCFLTSFNGKLKEIKKEVSVSSDTIEVYEVDKETKDIIIKVYDNKKSTLGKMLEKLAMFLILAIIVALFVVFVIYMMKLKLE